MSPSGDSGFSFERANSYAPGMGVPPPIGVNDPRIPPPAPDTGPMGMAGGLIVPPAPLAAPTQTQAPEVHKMKYGIYARKGDGYSFAALDESGDPLEMVNTSAEVIETVLKPILEVAGHKIVNYAGIDYSEEAKRIRASLAHVDDAFAALAKLPDDNVKPMRRRSA